MYKQVATERKNDQQAKLVVKLRKDIELLKEMVKEERLRNQKLQTKIEKDRLQKEIESPTFKLQ